MVIHLALFAGTFGAALWASRLGFCPLLGLGFLAVPAVISSLDRLTADIALAALCVGFVLLAEGPPRRLYVILLLAPLVRETGLILVVAAALFALTERRLGRALASPVRGCPPSHGMPSCTLGP